MRVYLDTAPVIYAIEQTAPYAERVHARLSSPDLYQVVSDLTRMECRVGPLRDGDQGRLQDFDDYFCNAAEVVGLSPQIMDAATTIRARYGFRTADAIHLAAAITSSCDLFLTNDRRLSRFGGIAIEVVT